MSTEIQLNKAIVADIFQVSRSAITQSTKNKPLATDIRARIIRYLFPRKMNSYNWWGFVQDKMKELLARARIIMRERSVDSIGKGRPSAKMNFTLFKRLVRDIIAQYDKWDNAVKDGFEAYDGAEIIEAMYGTYAIVHKVWGCIAYNGREMDYSLG